MASNPVVWFEIYVNDIERAKKFYETVLAVELAKLMTPSEVFDIEMWSFPASPEGFGSGGTICKMPGFEAGKNSVMVYFGCEDCEVEAGRVDAAGGKLHAPKMAIGQYGFVAHAYDTEGNLFGLHSMK
jgi:predicted enzyme related to lactoylglutathione lyase